MKIEHSHGLNDALCKVAIIGAGNMARQHIRAFQDIPHTVITGIHSRTRSRAEELAAEYNIPHVLDSVDELYNATQANLVVNTASVLAIVPVTLQCLLYDWTILIEKPPGITTDDAEMIASHAHKQNRKVYVGLNRRFYSVTQHVLSNLIQSNARRFIHVQDQQSMDVAARYGHPPQVVEHWMYVNTIHLMDYFTVFGRGDVVSVTPVIEWDKAHPDLVITKIEFSSGDIGLYEGLWNGPGPWAVSISTPDIRWEMRPLEQASFQRVNEYQKQSIDGHEYDTRFKAGFRLQAQAAVDAACGKPNALPTIDDALRTMHLIKRIF